MSSEQQNQLFKQIQQLDERLQSHLVEYIHMLNNSQKNREKLLSIIGTFSAEDIKAFEEAERESRKIDTDEW